MLQKNVYIIYPPGYGGNFLNWAINISDAESSKITVLNPINTNTNSKFGGSGTSHFHVRIPTHANIDKHMKFQLLHKIADKRVYICNDTWNNIADVLEYDPTAIFINIHDNNDELQKSFGSIQCCLKWPTFISAYCTMFFTKGRKEIHENFDPYNCKNDRLFRNYIIEHNFLRYNSPIEYDEIDKQIGKHERWYSSRNNANPHEVNENYYLPKLDYSGKTFEIDLKTLFSDSFVEWFEDFMHKSEVSDNYNTTQFRKIAPLYLNHQQNLQWFDSMLAWEKTGQIDDYLRSHAVIEAMFIRHLFIKTGQSKYLDFNLDKLTAVYNFIKKDWWPERPNSLIELFSLPGGVQTDLGFIARYLGIDYIPLADNARSEVIDYWPCYQLDWKNSSIDDINAVFQRSKATIL